jgi:nucleoside triphosphate diphosphatase
MASDVATQIERLVGIMARLRAEGGCPWDREQDLRSLRPYLIEETYEVLDEMDRVAYGGAWRPLCEELGDLLFQIVFHSQLASELQEFSMADVCQAISDKIESRHPHVFGDKKVSDSTQVLENWARLKAEEKKKKTGKEGSVLDGVPTAAPALMRAERLTEKASRIGFDWPDLKGVRGKLEEELRELDEAIASNDRDALEHELGDVLFSLANVARFIKTPPEDALRQANRRFTERFQQVEEGLRAKGIPFGAATLEQMDALWNDAKAKEKAVPPPRELPRAAVSRMELKIADVEAAAKFWAQVAPWIGWKTMRLGALEAMISDGVWELRFVQETGAQPKLTVKLDAPSRRAVDALKAKLAAAGISHDVMGVAVRFEDPAGVAWQYTFGAAV